MARLGQKAENEFVGVSCGSMDQLASAAAEPGCALLIDCRSLETRAVPFPEGAAVVVMDTGSRRTLAGSAYNERRASCERAVAILRPADPTVEALRDVDRGMLERFDAQMDEDLSASLPTWSRRTCGPGPWPRRFRSGDLGRLGDLMNESHASLRDLYEVSSPELDLITRAGARATRPASAPGSPEPASAAVRSLWWRPRR